jgi:hypothetical protein
MSRRVIVALVQDRQSGGGGGQRSVNRFKRVTREKYKIKSDVALEQFLKQLKRNRRGDARI